MKPRYKLGFHVQTSGEHFGKVTSVIREESQTLYRLNGEPTEYLETDITNAFRPIVSRDMKKKTPVTKKKVMKADQAQATQ